MANCIAFHPQSTSNVWLGSDNGVFRSTDGGETWLRSSSGLSDTRVEALVVDPDDPSRLLAATQGGVFRSENGGLSWAESSQGLTDRFVQALVLDPAHPQVVLAATRDGIFKSEDGGLNWSESGQGVDFDRIVLSLAASPTLPDTFYAVTLQFGVHKSVDGGSTWVRISTGNTGLFSGVLAIDPQNETLFAVADQVMKSANGADWEALPLGGDVGLLSFDPAHPSRLLVSTSANFFLSEDDGETFHLAAQPPGFIGNNLHLMAYHPADPQIRFASGAGGTYSSNSGGANWDLLAKGLRIETARTAAVNPANPLGLYLGSDRGEMRSIDAGASWMSDLRVRDPRPVRKVLVHPADPRIILSAQGDRIRYSSDSGQTWATALSLSTQLMRTIVRAPSDPKVVYAGIGNLTGFAKSTDGGQDFGFFEVTSPTPSVTAIAVSPYDAKVLFAGGSQGLFKSTDGGGSWAPVMEGLSDIRIHSLAIDPADPQVAYAGTAEAGVFKTANGGESWQALGGPGTAIIRSLLIDPEDSQHLWAAGWGEGIFESRNGGQSWQPFNQGLENPFVWELSLGANPVRRIFASTLGGLLARSLAEVEPPDFLSVEMEVSGNPYPGGLLLYVIRLINQGQAGQDDQTARLTAAFSPLLDLIEVRSQIGLAQLGPGDKTMSWEGVVGGGQTVLIEVRAAVLDSPGLRLTGLPLTGRAALSVDSDGDGEFDSLVLSSDPAGPVQNGSTVIQIVPSSLERELLAVPYAFDIPSSFVGLALANLAAMDNGLQFLALDQQGQIQQESDEMPFPGGTQIPFLTDEAFDQPYATLAMRGTEFQLQGFFLIGDADQDRLDGLGAPLEDSQLLYFPQLRSDGQTSTHLFIFNSDAQQPAHVHLQALGDQGNLLADVGFDLSPFASMQAAASELFGPMEIEDGYIRLDADRPVRGFALLADDERFATVAARRPPSFSERFYAPHLFWNDQGGTSLLRLFNPGNQTLEATLRLRDPLGELLAEESLQAAPGRLLVLDVRDLEEIGEIPSGEGSAEIEVQADMLGPFPLTPQLMADIVYDGGILNTLSTLPLVEDLSDETVFLQVAQSLPSGIFQGLALYNPDPDASQFVRVEAFSESGEMTASTFVVLQPRQRFVGLLNDADLFGEDFEQLRGYLEVATFGAPIASFALFGGPRFLSALQGVPPFFPISIFQQAAKRRETGREERR